MTILRIMGDFYDIFSFIKLDNSQISLSLHLLMTRLSKIVFAYEKILHSLGILTHKTLKFYYIQFLCSREY